MIYLAGPYTHDDPKIREERFEALTKKAAELMLDGYVVFSPITYGHTISERHTLPDSWEWWRGQCFGILRHASRLIVLRLSGYSDSVGVNAEIKFALSIGLDIEWVDPILKLTYI